MMTPRQLCYFFPVAAIIWLCLASRASSLSRECRRIRREAELSAQRVAFLNSLSLVSGLLGRGPAAVVAVESQSAYAVALESTGLPVWESLIAAAVVECERNEDLKGFIQPLKQKVRGDARQTMRAVHSTTVNGQDLSLPIPIARATGDCTNLIPSCSEGCNDLFSKFCLPGCEGCTDSVDDQCFTEVAEASKCDSIPAEGIVSRIVKKNCSKLSERVIQVCSAISGLPSLARSTFQRSKSRAIYV